MTTAKLSMKLFHANDVTAAHLHSWRVQPVNYGQVVLCCRVGFGGYVRQFGGEKAREKANRLRDSPGRPITQQASPKQNIGWLHAWVTPIGPWKSDGHIEIQ